ncbi:hypothetical protein [Streptomyces sp. MB09-01]|uniref:hypothetical protein n=1 Tax=Streptomyces sp. MB09-01 TaxID=3028666 RepID=UPI0029CA6A5D|nr:hypothetical protein [Streptomyces sp. MB09-01]
MPEDSTLDAWLPALGEAVNVPGGYFGGSLDSVAEAPATLLWLDAATGASICPRRTGLGRQVVRPRPGRHGARSPHRGRQGGMRVPFT